MSILDGLILLFALPGIGLFAAFLVRRYRLGTTPDEFLMRLDTAALHRDLELFDSGSVLDAERFKGMGALQGDVEKELTAKNHALLRANRSLLQSKTQLRRLVEKLYDVKEREGIRVARELHDELGQVLTGLKIEIALLERKLRGAGAAQAVKTAEETLELVDSAIARVQNLSKELRPPMLDKLGLMATFETVLREISWQTGVRYTLAHRIDDEDLAPGTLTCAYRVFKETISALADQNCVRTINARVEKSPSEITIRIDDDGAGAPKELYGDDSVGVLGMTEYVRKHSGLFEIVDDAALGTVIRVTLPIAS